MILSGLEIKNRIGKDIEIDPYNENQINTNSYNLKLHNKLLVYKEKIFDMKKPLHTEKIIIPKKGFILEPNKLYLGRTVEYTKTKNLVPMLEGRSSVGRLGMFVHVTAGFGDVGFEGFWTLEIFCVQPVKIYPNVEICQIYYHNIEGEYEKYISEKYQKNKEIRLTLDYEKDLLFFRELYKHISILETGDNIIKFILEHPEIANINYQCQQDFLENKKLKMGSNDD